MDFTNEFTVDAPLATVWEFMQNAEEVTPCVPGAAITEQVDETHYKGTVKVKLGAVQMIYRGEMEMMPNEADRTITLQAKGRETRGSGGASGTVMTRLVDVGDGKTKVEIHSQIDVTGRVAQFGRGIMQDVANRLIKDFAGCLEQKMTAATSPAGPVAQSGAASASSATVHAPASQPAASQSTGSPPASSPPSAAVTGSAGTSAEAAPVPASSMPHESSGAVQGTSTSIAAAGSGRSVEPPGAANELSISQLLVDVFRSRAAGWLRSAANRIEPK